MNKTNIKLRSSMRFKRFSRKGYALFSVLGREVLIGTLSVCTLAHAKAESVSVDVERAADSLQRSELRLEEVVVTGSRAPLTPTEQAKIVSVITRTDIERAAAESVNDVLKLATGVDVRQRGGFGVQTDISILGGTFDQIAILLNGVNISNPHTGHLSADFPVSLSDIERIEIIEGAASRVYGSGAFRGAVNIVTKSAAAATDGRLGLELEGGSYGTFGLGGRAQLSPAQSLSMGYKQSDGGTENSYFRKSQGFYQGRARLGAAVPSLSWQLGLSTMRYGANTFYSAAYPNQYESNLRLIASVRADMRLGKVNLSLTPYWNRSHDHFQLIRGSATGENFHRTDVVGATLNAHLDWALGRTLVGTELRSERIVSTNLGRPLNDDELISVWRHEDVSYDKKCRRTDANIFLEHNVLLKHFTASAGVVANRNTGYDGDWHLYPGVDVCYYTGDAAEQGLRLTASWNMGFRMPTFTDLFYKSPTQLGNIGLKPERTHSLRIGAKYDGGCYTVQASAFLDKGTDMIDWVMYTADDVYHSAGFDLTNRGFEANGEVRQGDVTLRLGYAYIDQSRHDDVVIYKSNYAMEYLRHKVTATLQHPIVSRLSASWAFRWQQRMGSYIVYENHKSTGEARPYKPYGLLDLKLSWTAPRYVLTLSLNNLTSYRYYDLGNVRQPGLWVMGSAKVILF